ncbi:MAG TPA: cytochrome c oxidase assembly protein [Ktedonobacteraceae bacterium]
MYMLKKQALGLRGAALLFGIFLAIVAFFVPMDVFGMDHMFAVHMAQHLLLSLAAPPLMLFSMTAESLSRFFARHHALARCVKCLTIPFVASALFNGNIWIWHAPLLMQVMMGSPLFHDITNLLYLLTGLLFWLPLFDLLPEEMHPLSLGKKMIYLLFSDMPMMLIGAGLTFSPPLYAFTMTDPPMHMTVTAGDQQLGGLLMWVVGGVFLLGVVSSVLFLRWMLQQEKQQEERDRALVAEMTDASLFARPFQKNEGKLHVQKNTAMSPALE